MIFKNVFGRYADCRGHVALFKAFVALVFNDQAAA